MNATEQIKAVKKAATDFLVAWKGQKYTRMQECTTHTYRYNYPGNQELKTRLPNRIKSYRILSVSMANPTMCDVIMYVKYQGADIKLYMRLIQETAAFYPSSAGDWGVNPISIRQVVKDKKPAA